MREDLYRTHDKLESSHWWFVARRSILRAILARNLPQTTGGGRLRLLDIGCGTGLWLEELSRLGEAIGLEPSETARHLAAHHTTARIVPGALPNDLPADLGQFHVITLLDVLEHLDDDVAALRAVVRLLEVGGIALATVPALASLWSAHDEAFGHKRRYTRAMLGRCLSAAGLSIRRMTYFNTLLFPPIFLARKLMRGGRRARGSDFDISPPGANALLRAIFSSERFLLYLCNFPIGVSLLAIATRHA